MTGRGCDWCAYGLFRGPLLAPHGPWCSEACAATEEHMHAMDLDAEEQVRNADGD